MEIWKDVVGFEGCYEVSNFGNVRSVDRVIVRNNGTVLPIKGKLLRLQQKSNGRVYANLSKENKRYCKTVHRLVMTAFVANPKNLPHINHKDEDPTNNRLDNLEWCTEEYNYNYGTRNERCTKSKYKPINVYDLQGNFICSYESIKCAAKDLNCDESCITKVCKGKNKYHRNYIFKYI